MSAELKQGNLVECVKIFSSPKLRKKRAKSVDPTYTGDGSNPASPTGEEGMMTGLHQVQVSSPLMTPKSGRERGRSTGIGSDLYGTSREAIARSRQHGKPGIVLNVTCKGAQQLRKSELEGIYILLEIQGERGEGGAESSTEDSIQPDYCIKTSSVSEQAYQDLQRIAFEQISSLPLSPRTKAEVTRDEWDGLPTVEMDQISNGPSSPLSRTRHITFTDLLVHYQRQRIGTKPTKKSKRDVPSLSKSLRAEYDLVTSLVATPLSDTDPLHIEALQTVYQKLTGSSLNCRRYGPHWLDVGFPSVDPGESLKGVGFFGLMQLVSFFDRSSALAMEIFNYSCSGTQQFPFAVVSISLTESALNALREGHLTKLCNKQEQVVVVLNDYHEALFHRFYLVWRSQSTASQISPVVQEVASYARRNPKMVLADVIAYHKSGKDEHELMPTRRISQSLSNPFTPFHTLPDIEETQTAPSDP